MLTGLVHGLIAQGTITDALIGGGTTAGLLSVAIGWLVKDRNKREDQHREDFRALNDQQQKTTDRLITAIENNTAAFTRVADSERELREHCRQVNDKQVNPPIRT